MRNKKTGTSKLPSENSTNAFREMPHESDRLQESVRDQVVGIHQSNHDTITVSDFTQSSCDFGAIF